MQERDSTPSDVVHLDEERSVFADYSILQIGQYVTLTGIYSQQGIVVSTWAS